MADVTSDDKRRFTSLLAKMLAYGNEFRAGALSGVSAAERLHVKDAQHAFGWAPLPLLSQRMGLAEAVIGPLLDKRRRSTYRDQSRGGVVGGGGAAKGARRLAPHCGRPISVWSTAPSSVGPVRMPGSSAAPPGLPARPCPHHPRRVPGPCLAPPLEPQQRRPRRRMFVLLLCMTFLRGARADVLAPNVTSLNVHSCFRARVGRRRDARPLPWWAGLRPSGPRACLSRHGRVDRPAGQAAGTRYFRERTRSGCFILSGTGPAALVGASTWSSTPRAPPIRRTLSASPWLVLPRPSAPLVCRRCCSAT